MSKKNLLIGAVIVAAVIFGFQFVNKDNSVKEADREVSENIEKPAIPEPQAVEVKEVGDSTEVKQAFVSKDVSAEPEDIKTDLSSTDLPLSVSCEMALLPENIQKTILNTAKASDNVYMMKNDKHKVVMVVENQGNLRHGVEFVEISIPSGHRTTTTFGYNDKMKDSNNDIWEYDKVSEVQRPIRHTKYDSEGDIEFSEVWNYDDNNPIKYEMKDRNGKTVSIRKETVDDGTNLRIENILYDSEGKIKVNVTASYEGADLKRFTYYNSDKLSESGSVFGDYKDGVKIRETVYTSDLKVKNVYEPVYKDGTATEIKILDNKNKEIRKLVEK